MEEVPGDDRVRRVRLGVERGAPRRHRIALVRPQPREPEVKLHDRDARDRASRAARAGRASPSGHAASARADLRLERVVLREQTAPRPRCHRARRAPAPASDRAPRDPCESRARTRAAAGPRGARAVVVCRRARRVAVRGERRRRRRPRPRPPRRQRRGARHGAARTPPDDSQARQRYSSESNGDVPRAARTGQERDRRDLAPSRRTSASSRRTARSSSTSASRTSGTRGTSPARSTRAAAASSSASRGSCPTRARPLVVYCSAGSRSAFAAKALEELGYENVVNLAGGFTDWKRNGFEVDDPARPLARAALALQPAPADPRGRRGGPAAPARRARPPDRRRRARLARVALPRRRRRRHARDRRRRRRRRVEPPAPDRPLDRPARRAEGRVSAKRTIEALNPDVKVVPFQERLTSENVDRILAEGWDVIVDGADNFPTRYLVNDASVWHGIPVVHGSIFRFEGQVTVFKPGVGPVLPLPLPAAAAARARAELRRGRRARRPARDHRLDPGERGAEARSSASATRSSAGCCSSTRSATTLDEVTVRREPRLPGLRRQPDDHRVHRLRRVLQRAGASLMAPSASRRRCAPRSAARASSRPTARPCAEVIDDLVERFPPLGAQLLQTASSRRS